MIGAIGGQTGLPDISACTPANYYGATASTTYVDVLNITGSGYLLELNTASAAGSTAVVVYVQINIDGATVFDGAINQGGYGGQMVGKLCKKFNTSLNIKMKAVTSTSCLNCSVALI